MMIRVDSETAAALEGARFAVGARSITETVRLLAAVADSERGLDELSVRLDGQEHATLYPVGVGVLARARRLKLGGE